MARDDAFLMALVDTLLGRVGFASGPALADVCAVVLALVIVQLDRGGMEEEGASRDLGNKIVTGLLQSTGLVPLLAAIARL